MAKKKDQGTQKKPVPVPPIRPDFLYTVANVANVFNVDSEWVMRNLVYTRACRHLKQGRIYAFLGQWIIDWATANSTPPDIAD